MPAIKKPVFILSIALPARVMPHLYFVLVVHDVLFRRTGLFWIFWPAVKLGGSWPTFQSRHSMLTVADRLMLTRSLTGQQQLEGHLARSSASQQPPRCRLISAKNTTSGHHSAIQAPHTPRVSSSCRILITEFILLSRPPTLDLFDRPFGSRCDIHLKKPGSVVEGGANKDCSAGRGQQGAPDRIHPSNTRQLFKYVEKTIITPKHDKLLILYKVTVFCFCSSCLERGMFWVVVVQENRPKTQTQIYC